MKIYDISMPISKDMQVYKNRETMKPDLEVVRDFGSASAYESRLCIHLHTGTHMDAPLHMIEGGETIDKLDLEKVITWCKVIDVTHVQSGITRKDLEDRGIEQGDFVLLKTKNSFSDAFLDAFVFVEKSGAAFLKEAGICGVGIDSLGIERSQPGHETHITLLGNGIPVLEGLRLKDIAPGRYFLMAVPVLISGAEAAPVRALLLDADPVNP